jgi:hypothetical protein
MRPRLLCPRELLRLYWSVGRDILERQENAGWGAKVIDHLAGDLHAAFPTSVASPCATCTTCGPSPQPGRLRRTFCHRLWHNFRGAYEHLPTEERSALPDDETLAAALTPDPPAVED